jgi:hypothetical protein
MILLSVRARLPNASISKITDTFNEQIDRRRTSEAVKSQLKKHVMKSKLQKRPGASSSKTQIAESAYAAAHSQTYRSFLKQVCSRYYTTASTIFC